MGRGSDRILSIIFEIAENILLLEVIADLNRSTTRTLRARATKIIPPHEIEFPEGVSIFIRERKTKILMAHIIRMVRHA